MDNAASGMGQTDTTLEATGGLGHGFPDHPHNDCCTYVARLWVCVPAAVDLLMCLVWVFGGMRFRVLALFKHVSRMGMSPSVHCGSVRKRAPRIASYEELPRRKKVCRRRVKWGKYIVCVDADMSGEQVQNTAARRTP